MTVSVVSLVVWPQQLACRMIWFSELLSRLPTHWWYVRVYYFFRPWSLFWLCAAAAKSTYLPMSELNQAISTTAEMLTSQSVGLVTCSSRPPKIGVLFPFCSTGLDTRNVSINCHLLLFFCVLAMPSEATETVPVTEQEMQQPQVETGSYDLLSVIHVLVVLYWRVGSWSSEHNCYYTVPRPCWPDVVLLDRPILPNTVIWIWSLWS